MFPNVVWRAFYPTTLGIYDNIKKVWIQDPKGVEYEGDGAKIFRRGKNKGDRSVIRASLGENERGGGK